mgnify:CR=1 FL=1
MSTVAAIETQTALLWLNFAGILVIGAVLYVRYHGRGFDRVNLAFATVTFVLALVLRVLVSPFTLIHENAHGYEYLQTAFSGEGFPLHGAGYYAFFRVVTVVLGREPVVVFLANVVLSSATAALLLPLGKLLTGDRNVGVFAGLLFAMWPASIRIAASESMFPLAVFVGAATLCVWLSAVRSGDKYQYLLAGLLLSFSVQIRPMMALWPPILAIATISQPGWRGEVKRSGPWMAAVACVVMSTAWLAFRVLDLKSQGVHSVVDLSPLRAATLFFSSENLLWNGRWTPVSALVLAALGVAVTVRSNWRVVVVLITSASLLSWFALAPSAGAEVSQLRLQGPIQLFLVLGAGLGAAFICGALPQRFRLAGSVVLVVLLGIAAALRYDTVREIHNPQEEFRFLQETVGGLPGECMVVTARKSMAHGVITTEFPAWWLDDRPLSNLSNVAEGQTMEDLWPCVVWYRGLTCYSFTWQEREAGEIPESGFRRECARAEEAVILVPLAETSISSKPYVSYIRPEREDLDIGFYQVLAKGHE